MPRVIKGGDEPEGKPIRPLRGIMARAMAPSRAAESVAHTPEPVIREEGPADRQRPQVSEQSLERVQRLLHEMVTAFSEQREELLKQMRPSVVRLVVGMARRIVGRELETDREAIRRVIDEALGELGRSGRVAVRVSPADAEVLREAVDQNRWAPPSMVELDIVADPAVSSGGCVLESDYGRVDATIETQLDELARTLDEQNGDGTPAQ